MKKSKNRVLILAIAFSLVLALLLTGCTLWWQDPELSRDNGARYVVTNSSSDLGTSSKELEEVIAEIQPTVVEIYCTVAEGTSAGSGVIAGVATNADGAETGTIIITNHHVIEGATSIAVKLFDGTTHEAAFVGSDYYTDIAVIRIGKTGLKAATWIDDSSRVRVGATAIVVGNPLGSLGGTVTRGIVSGLARDVNVDGITMTLMQTDAAINSGNSGGGLFNAAGNLVGIVNAKYSSSAGSTQATIEGLGFAIPRNVAYPIMEELLTTSGSEEFQYGYIAGRYRLGLWISSSTVFGMTVSDVDADGVAYAAGLRKNDMILSVSVGGVTKTDVEGMMELLGSKEYELGQKIVVECQSSNSTIIKSYTMTLKQFVYVP